MTAHEQLWEAQRFVERNWRADPSSEKSAILEFARDVLQFISATGQRHHFSDYRHNLVSGCQRRRDASGPGDFTSVGEARQDSSLSPEERLRRTHDFFVNLLNGASPEDAAWIEVMLDALQFVAMTGQLSSLTEYIEHLDAGAPPYAVAAFDSLQEAEAWLKNHPKPPDFAHIIVGHEYRSVFHDREKDIRKLPNDNAIEYYLAELRKEEPPVVAASFATHEEAKEWINAQANPARRTWVLIGGEVYLAAYYANINHRALFPLSLADGFQL